MNPFRALTTDEAKLMKSFATGKRSLFVVKARGKAAHELGFADITVQKVTNDQFGIMLWKEAADAEKFILEHGRTTVAEGFEITADVFWQISLRLFGEQSAAKYVLR